MIIGFHNVIARFQEDDDKVLTCKMTILDYHENRLVHCYLDEKHVSRKILHEGIGTRGRRRWDL